MRLTTRKMMLVVALTAVCIVGVRGCFYILEGLNEPYIQTIETTQSWDLGPKPIVSVDSFAGSIHVMPAHDGLVTARISRVAEGADHQADADQEVRTIVIQCEHHDDTLRIMARDGTGSACQRYAYVYLYAPPGTQLDLRMGSGQIVVGYDFAAAWNRKVPMVSPSIRARNDAINPSFATQCDIRIVAAAPPGGSAPVRLQLDSAGKIEVEADRATVEARAWPEIVPPGSTPSAPERQQGTILIRSNLVGENTVRSARGIELHLPPETACRVEAEAHGGGVTGNTLPPAIPPQEGVTRWAGSIGEAPTAAIHLRADDGSILIDRSP